jgi:hypothetical protein
MVKVVVQQPYKLVKNPLCMIAEAVHQIEDLHENRLLGMSFCMTMQACIAHLWTTKSAPVEFVKHGSEIPC